MKKNLLIIPLLLTLLLSAGVSAESLSPALDIIAAENSMTVSGLSGEAVTFSQSDFENAAGGSVFESITVASLPSKDDGVLYLSDTAVSAGQKIQKKSLESLRFEPEDGTEKTSFLFSFDSNYTMTCSIVYTDRQNKSPTVTGNVLTETFCKTDCTGCMRASDPDSDKIVYEIVDYPEYGYVSFDPATGSYRYSPSSKPGTDSFSYRARDEYGAYSGVCKVSVDVVRNTSSLAFSDMSGNGAATAAVCMCSDGYMTYSEENGKMYFDPADEVSRLDFLVSAMNVFGASKIPEIEKTGFADDDKIPGEYKGYVYSAEKLGIISGVPADGSTSFMPDKPITRAEASVILNNIIGYKSTGTVTCSDSIPDWADGAVSAMYELGIYDLDEGEAKAAGVLVKEDAAQMLFNLSCLLGE